MATKPTLEALALPKAGAAPAPPLPRPAVTAGAPKSLTVKLDPDLYARLRRYCLDQMESGGKEPSHQEVLTTALREYLGD